MNHVHKWTHFICWAAAQEFLWMKRRARSNMSDDTLNEIYNRHTYDLHFFFVEDTLIGSLPFIWMENKSMRNLLRGCTFIYQKCSCALCELFNWNVLYNAVAYADDNLSNLQVYMWKIWTKTVITYMANARLCLSLVRIFRRLLIIIFKSK